jgi:hypothetical protein
MRVFFHVVNSGSSSNITLSLNITSTFRYDGYTTPSEAYLNGTSVSLAPMEARSVQAYITPDSGISPGSYSVGVSAQSGNESTVGILVLQVTPNPVDQFLFQTLPAVLNVGILFLVVGNIFVYARLSRIRNEPLAKSRKAWTLVCEAIGAAFILLQPAIPVAFSKCPGLPGLGSSSGGPNYVGIITLTVEASVTAVLAYFLVRGLLILRQVQEGAGSQ